MGCYSQKSCSAKGSEVLEPAIVLLGMFDGIHLGHQKLIERAVHRKTRTGWRVILYSFKQNPKKLIQGLPQEQLMPIFNKINFSQSLGVDQVILEDFTEKFRNQSKEEFIQRIVRLGAKTVIVGEDYHFGRDREGTPSDLISFGKKYGFETEIIPPYQIDGVTVSSSKIREFLLQGKMEEAAQFLGRHFSVSGIVVAGKHLGGQMGFKTLNIKYEPDIIQIPFGVYATRTLDMTIGGNLYKSISNVGVAPTFNGTVPLVETHAFGLNKDVYGHLVKVKFYEFLRLERQFESKQELIRTVQKDIETVKKMQY